MIYRKEINERSPLRVFERSIHGGLGRGNIGLIMSRPGVGKTAFMIDIALDDLMRDRKVLHITTDHPAEKARAFYDEVFHDLAKTSKLENPSEVHRRIERNRMIHSFLHGSFHLGRMREALGYMKEHAHFEPFLVVLDGFPRWEEVDSSEIETQLRELKKLATEFDFELWLSAHGHREDERDATGVPLRLQPFLEYLAVVVRLVPQAEHVRLQLVKDHDNPDLAALHLELDPTTLLLKWQ